jgi:deoxyhypusine synthase
MVSKEKPLIGYNMIEHYIHIGGADVENGIQMRSSFPGFSGDSVQKLVNVVKNNTDDRLCDVRIGRRPEMISAGAQKILQIKVK